MIINLTQHPATLDQLLAGVVDLPPDKAARLRQLLTFQVSGPTGLVSNLSAASGMAKNRAFTIVNEMLVPYLVEAGREILSFIGESPIIYLDDVQVLNLIKPSTLGHGIFAMIGGAPFFMAPLEAAILSVGVTPVYALSDRVSIEEPLSDGSTRKTQVFKHLGFIPAIR